MLVRGALVFVLVPVAVALVTSLFASRARLATALRDPAPGLALRFGADTFAFRNDSRIHHRGKPDLYSNWCFVMARAVVAPDDRVVVPGFASLHALSGAETEAVKAGLGGRLWSLVHWTNWRLVYPSARAAGAHRGADGAGAAGGAAGVIRFDRASAASAPSSSAASTCRTCAPSGCTARP